MKELVTYRGVHYYPIGVILCLCAFTIILELFCMLEPALRCLRKSDSPFRSKRVCLVVASDGKLKKRATQQKSDSWHMRDLHQVAQELYLRGNEVR